jgi:hypothetical protein
MESKEQAAVQRTPLHQFIKDIGPFLTVRETFDPNEFCDCVNDMGCNFAPSIIKYQLEGKIWNFVNVFEMGMDFGSTVNELTGMEWKIFECGRTVSMILDQPWIRNNWDPDPHILSDAFQTGLLLGIAGR